MTPQHLGTVQGRSFPRAIQALATLAVVLLLVGGWRARAALAHTTLPPEGLLLAGLAGAVVLWGYLNILFSTTRVSDDAISQGWLWQTRVPLREIAQVKLLRWKPLDSVIAPRLVVRAGGLGNVTFHVADPAVLAVVDVLVHGRAEEPAA